MNKGMNRIVTMNMTMANGDRIVITQKLIPPSHEYGHYEGYVEDKDKNIIKAFSSTCAPPEPITVPFLVKQYKCMTEE